MNIKRNILLWCIFASVSALEKYVSLRDMTPEPGLPEHILVDVIGSEDNVVRLELKQNKRLNENADIYERDHEHQNLRRFKMNDQLMQDIKYYHDVQNKAAVSITCNRRLDGQCKRELEGFFDIRNVTYEIRPAGDSFVTRMLGARYLNVHVVKGVSMSDEKNLKVKQPEKMFELKDYIDSKSWKNIKQKESKYKRQRTEYAVECFLVIDPFLWRRFYRHTSKAENRVEVTKYRLRRHLARVMNGISLRYESIEDPELNMYVTISGFMFFEDDDENSPVPKGEDAPTYINKKPLVDAEKYLKSSVKWLNQTDLENDDHVMIFTECDLFFENITKTAVAGMSFVGGACDDNRVSIQEMSNYYKLATTAAHELGHNLGAHHDGHSSNDCEAEDKYLMAPNITRLSFKEEYRVNPWRFSPCSIDAFKDFLQSDNSWCLKDHGDYFDKTEWEEHNKKLPGEINSLDAQCRFLIGPGSGVCPSIFTNIEETDEKICQQIYCITFKGCKQYTPARGTPCGNPEKNKWCIEGKCVSKETWKNNCFETTATEYNGKVNVTKYGEECVSWVDLANEYPDYFIDFVFPDSSIAEASNYCRAPDNNSRPWCIYMDGDTLESEYCDIRRC